MKKLVLITIVSLFIFSCDKQKKVESESNLSSFEKELMQSVSYVLDSTYCKGGMDRMLQIRHQKYKGDDYIQIASVYDYTTDSLFYSTEYKNNLVVFYNEPYFKSKIAYNKTKKDYFLKKYKNYNADYSNGIISEKRCFEIFLVKNNHFKILNHSSYQYNNLFDNPPMALPSIPPSLPQK